MVKRPNDPNCRPSSCKMAATTIRPRMSVIRPRHLPGCTRRLLWLPSHQNSSLTSSLLLGRFILIAWCTLFRFLSLSADCSCHLDSTYMTLVLTELMLKEIIRGNDTNEMIRMRQDTEDDNDRMKKMSWWGRQWQGCEDMNGMIWTRWCGQDNEDAKMMMRWWRWDKDKMMRMQQCR